MASYEKFIECGKALGLQGEALFSFVEKKEADRLDREERASEREVHKLKLEREAREREHEFELAKKEADSKVKMVQMEVEMEKLKKMDGSHVSFSSGGSHVKAKSPRLPAFNERQDKMDAYLKRFERFAENAAWDRSDWATNLSALVQGKALDVYSRLSPDDALDYDIFKESLLKRFQLTEDGFRQKFRNSKLEVGETVPQFIIRLTDYLARWMELAKAPESFEGLRDLMLREQFMQIASKNLQVFLKERKISSVTDMAELAEQYQEAHGVYESIRHNPGSKGNFGSSDQSSQHQSFNPEAKVRERYCYHCKSKNHFIRDCPKKGNYGRGSTFKAAGLTDHSQDQARGRGTQYHTRGGYRGRGGFSRGSSTRGADGRSDEDTKVKTVASCGIEENLGQFEECCVSNSRVTLQCGHEFPVMTAACKGTSNDVKVDNLPVYHGVVNQMTVKVLRDSGCSGVVVRRDLVQANQLTGNSKGCMLLDGTVRQLPIAWIHIDTPFFTGDVEALCAENPVFDLILGNIPDARDPGNPDKLWSCHTREDGQCELGSAVQTRAQVAKEGKFKPLNVTSPIGSIDIKEVRTGQEADDTLHTAKERVVTGEKKIAKRGGIHWYEKQNGLIYRRFQSEKVDSGKLFKQLLVPKQLREHVLKLAHDSILAGHLGVRKMTSKILYEFYWPGVMGDISRYCRSCDLCQKTFSKGKVKKVPVGELPLIDTPFARVAVDLIGPIHPPTEKGNRFILTMVDYATRYPEAVALKYIDSERVAEALFEMFSRVGIPSEILSDMGKQFTSAVMKEVGRLLSMKQMTTTPYNPACNGLIERFNGTLKNMLKKKCAEQPKQWDRYIPALLFAYREAPQESLAFSPFELLYGRTVRGGPLTILKELWTSDIQSEEVKTTYQYVLDL
ncbi:MAG: DDE-type integrase/transposase/recombinase, partial [Sedimenticola sp.]